MTDLPVKRITQLPNLIDLLDGTEVFPLVHGGVTYKYTMNDLAAWMIASQHINRPPVTSEQAANVLDTDAQCNGNLLAGAIDYDADPIFFQSLVYNGEAVDLNAGSFQTQYGIFFLNPVTGNWTFTLGFGAKSLNTGDIAHEIFTYTLADGKGGLATSHLTITITGTNSVPVVNYVNDSTPVNLTLTGNLIAHYAFDYETTPTIASFVIDGIAGTHAANAIINITDVGSIEIDVNGDYTFIPLPDWTGAVPLITYNVTDGVNVLPAYLTLAVTPLVPGTAPIILYTDIVSGPISGGENDKGTYLTLWGFRFGPSSGMGSTLKLYIGGHEVDNYRELITDTLSARFPNLQRLTVQVGAIGSPTLGQPLPIKLVVSGQESNQNNIFTPNPGRILFVSQGGNDLTAIPGDITKPYRMLQYPARGDGGIYPILLAGDTVVIRGGDWSDLGYDTSWFRFRDPQQNGSNPMGVEGTGWIMFMPYPTEDVHYTTPPGGNKGGFQGPGSAFSGTCGDWVTISKFRMEVSGGSSGDAAPVNMQYNTGHWRVVGNNFGPWPAGTSPSLNAACITGQGNFILIALNYLHDIEGTTALQNHGTYAGTSSYGWDIAFNWYQNMVGGSHCQFNDSDGGTMQLNTPYGIWTGFTNCRVHHNFMENSAKYGVTFSDVGAGGFGDLSALVYNNVIIGTGLSPLRLNTTGGTSDVLYAFNTVYNCLHTFSGSGNAILRNEGNQASPTHSVKAYNNIFAFGPDTVSPSGWFVDYSGQGSGYDLQRNLYYAYTQSPSAPTDSLAIFGDPKFNSVTPGALDLSLQATSPAINAGTKALPAGVSVNDDFTGQASRQFGGAPDLGAYEVGQTTPYVITAPSFSGGPQVGVSTSATLGTWGNSPTSYSRQFTVNGVAAGAPHSGTGTYTYTPVGADARKTLRCEVTATNADGSSLFTLLIGDIALGAGAPTCTVLPVVTGTLNAGNTLSSTTGTWTGTVSGYLYQWLRDGIAVAGATSSTYALTGPDVGHQMACQVTAQNSTTGDGIATSANTGTIGPAAADPQFVQVKVAASLLGSGLNDCTFDSNVAGNNLILLAISEWDNSPYNATISDTQGHSSAVSGDYTSSSRVSYLGSDNPALEWFWTKSNATGPYTTHINLNGSNGGCMMALEIQGQDLSSTMDIPPETSTAGGTGSITLNSTTPTTKPNDLVLVAVAGRGSGATFTAGSGWDLVAQGSGTYNSMAVFKRKETSIETFSFTASVDNTNGWVTQSIVLKGS